MGFLSKVFGGIKKIIKGVGKVIKKGVRKIGGFFKKVFKGIGKFIGKLGPIGMLGMMLIMPQLGAWWSQFGSWAGQLTGPMGTFMKGVYAAGNFVGKAYTSVTEGIDKIVGGFAESVGLGDAYQGAKSWVGEKTEALQNKLGLHTEASAAQFKADLEVSPIQEITVTAQKRPVAADAIQEIDVTAVKKPTVITKADLEAKGYETLAESAAKAKAPEGVDVNTWEEALYASGGAPGVIDDRSGFEKVADTLGEISTKVKSIQELAAELGLTEEEYMEHISGGGWSAEASVAISNSIEDANADWTLGGGVGQAPYGPASQFWQQGIVQAAHYQDPHYLMWMPRAKKEA